MYRHSAFPSIAGVPENTVDLLEDRGEPNQLTISVIGRRCNYFPQKSFAASSPVTLFKQNDMRSARKVAQGLRRLVARRKKPIRAVAAALDLSPTDIGCQGSVR